MSRLAFLRIAACLVCVFAAFAGSALALTERVTTSRLQGLCVRQTPDSGSKIVRALRAGEEAVALERRGDWILVRVSGGATGWVHGGYLTGFGITPPALYASRLLPDASPGDAAKQAPFASAAETAPAKPAPLAGMAAPALGQAASPPSASSAAPSAAPESALKALDALAARSAAVLGGHETSSRKTASGQAAPAFSQGRYRIEVYLNEHRLYLFEKLPDGGRRLVSDYEVATPGGDVAAPEGWGVVTGIDFNPSWTPTANMKRRARLRGRPLPDYVAPGLKSNPMGTFKIYLSHGEGYRIHGNNNPRSIGKAVTSGCIRMRNDEGAGMARMIDVGSEVVFF